MSESIDCRQLQADIDELREKRNILQKQIDGTAEGVEEVDSEVFRRSEKEFDETVNRILEKNIGIFFEHFPLISENVEMVDPPIEVGPDDRYAMLEDGRAIIHKGKKVYYYRKNEAGEWGDGELLEEQGDSYLSDVKFIRIDDEYCILSYGFESFQYSALYRDNGDSLEKVGATGAIDEKTATYMGNGTAVWYYEKSGELLRSELLDREKGNGTNHYYRWQHERIPDVPGDAELECHDGRGCYIFKESDGNHLFYIDEDGNVTDSLLEGPDKEPADIRGVTRITDDLIIVLTVTKNGDAYYSYRLKNGKPHFLSEVNVPTDTVRRPWFHFSPLDDYGHFIAYSDERMCQYSPVPDEEGSFLEQLVVAPDGKQLFPRPYDYFAGDRRYELGNQLFLYSKEEGWKVVKMEEPGEQTIEELKRQLIQTADRAGKRP